MFHKVSTLIFLCFTLLSVHSFANVGTATTKQVIKTIEQLRQQHQLSALSYAFVEQGKVVASGGLGHYSIEQRRPVTADSLVRVGSLTKLVTALGIYKLINDNKLSLDTPIKQLLPDIPLQNPWAANHPVTIGMLLEHSSGLKDLTMEEFNYLTPLSLTEAFKIAPEQRQVHWQPGLHPEYSNTGSGYLGRAIEVLTGQTWDQWTAENILQPLEMNRSSTVYSPQLQQQLVVGYDQDHKSVLPYWHTLFRPFGSLNTTANDFSNLLLLLLNEGRLGNRQWMAADLIKSMETPSSTIAAKQGHDYGYGAGIYGYYRDGIKLLGHGGDGDGYLAHFAYNHSSQRGFFVVINAYDKTALAAIRKPLERWVIAALAKTSPADDDNVDHSHLLGLYRQVTQRFNWQQDPELIELASKSGQLHYRYQGYQKLNRLISTAPNQYRRPSDSGPSHLFFSHQGRLYWQSDLGNFIRVEE